MGSIPSLCWRGSELEPPRRIETMDPLKADNPTAPTDTERPEQPLGRGLEQISHLFLSHRTNDVRAVLPSPSQAPARTVSFQLNTSVAKNQLVAMLREVQGHLEPGLRVIDVLIPCHPHGEIDLLAVDHANQLVIIDFETAANDALVLRGMAHFDWLLHNLPIVRRMHPELTIALSAEPRLFLLAPTFSSLAITVAGQLTQPQITWICYHVLETNGITGIFFQPMAP